MIQRTNGSPIVSGTIVPSSKTGRPSIYRMIVLEVEVSCHNTVRVPVAQDFPKILHYSIEVR
jgi:hypothetical protein